MRTDLPSDWEATMAKWCEQCGTENGITQNFCGQCGATRFRLTAAPQPPTPSPVGPSTATRSHLPPQPTRKAHPVRNLLALFLLIGGALWWVHSVTTGGGSSDDSGAGGSGSSLLRVTYLVDGTENTRTADITYRSPNGGTEQQSSIDVPMINEASGKEGISFRVSSESFLYISAQRNDGDDGDITCTIKVDGLVLVTNTSSGPYSVVTCSA